MCPSFIKLISNPMSYFRKECVKIGVNPSCDRLCNNHGYCDNYGQCVCRTGWEGRRCSDPVCHPQCMNGGACSSPNVCDCPAGFQGRSCEGGICEKPCQNKGKCIQKDTCQCRSGWYGTHCQFSKCVVPCLNGGECRGVNKCRCLSGFTGDHCQLVITSDRRRGHSLDTGDTGSGVSVMCTRDQCRNFKKCRKQNCDYIDKSKRLQLRTCKISHCGSLLQCDKSSCNSKSIKYRRRTRQKKYM